MILGDVLGAHVPHAPRHALVEVGRRGHHGGVGDEGRQVGMRRRRVMQGRVTPGVELWLLGQHQTPTHPVLLENLGGGARGKTAAKVGQQMVNSQK